MDIACETVFLKELQKNKSIILTKENTRSARDKKRLAWMAIQQVLVSTSGREYSVQQLCKKWNNLQQRVKEKIRNNTTDKVNKTLHERDLLCLQIIGPENLNLPPGSLDISYTDLKTEDEDCPVVVPSDYKTDQQVLDLVMSNPELKNNLVTSLASLQNSLSPSLVSLNSLNQSLSPGMHGSPGARSDITLQDMDNIQTNIFNELATRISQINSGIVTSQHDMHMPHLTITSSETLCPVQGSPGGVASGDSPRHKRKRSSSAISWGEPAAHTAAPICTPTSEALKRELLLLKREKLQLKNEKTRLEIARLRRQSFSVVETATQTSSLPGPPPLQQASRLLTDIRGVYDAGVRTVTPHSEEVQINVSMSTLDSGSIEDSSGPGSV